MRKEISEILYIMIYNKLRLFLCLIPVFLATSFYSCNYYLSSESIVIENEKISLSFDPKNGSLTSLRNVESSYDMVDGSIPGSSPWEIELDQNGLSQIIDNRSARTFRYSKPDPSTLLLVWKKFDGAGNRKIVVNATITLENNKPLSLWKISVKHTGKKQIRQVIFPRIAGLKDPGEEYLAVPQWMGQIMKDPRKCLSETESNIKRYEWTYPGLSLQCVALYSPVECGFYGSCLDTLVYIKNFSFSLDTLKTLVYRMSNFPSVDPASTFYELPYSAVVGTFMGDWITAAEIYREWGSKQKWARDSRFSNKKIPEWLENTALWVWNRGRSGNVLSPAADLKERLGLPVSVFWHWWHGCSYDDGFPEYLPPREGKDSFISAVSDAQKKGIRSVLYMNQRLWGTTTASWKNENASVWAVKDIDGDVNTHTYNIFTNKPAASMCIGTRFWKDKYASLADSAVNQYKANGIYMDQACLALKCYDNNHDHPIGPGNYWFNNFSRLTGQIRSGIPETRQLVLAGEGCGEAWLPYLDVFLTLAVSKERYAGLDAWETIPFFQAVYHQYSITYGNYSSLLVPPYDELWPQEYAPEKPLEMLDERFNKQFLMEQARSFVWGMQPTIANYQSFLAAARKKEIDYLINISKVRDRALKYLLYGRFLRNPETNSLAEDFDISRLSIYAGKQGESVTAFRGNFHLIYAGTWQADNNDVGIALTSISDNSERLTFKFNADDYNLPRSGRISVIDKNGSRLLKEYTGNEIVFDMMLEPGEACVIEFTSGK